MVNGDHGTAIAAETDSEPVGIGTQRDESEDSLQVVTQENTVTSAPLPALLSYLGSLPLLFERILLPLPTKDNDELLILFARETGSSAKQTRLLLLFLAP